MKKTIALLASLMMLASMGTAALSANAAMMKSDREDYDYYYVVTRYYTNEDGESVPYYKYIYLDFAEHGKSHYCEVIRDHDLSYLYSYVFVTVGENADTETLFSILGEEAEDVYYHAVADDQLAFEYSSDLDYESLYDIAGVEKVELAKYQFKGGFGPGVFFEQNDPWPEENGIDQDKLYLSGLLQACVKTAPDVTLTPEMFADTGFNVRHVFEYEPGNWYVYYDDTGLESITKFDAEAEKIDGVLSSMVLLEFEESAGESLVFDTVERAAVEPSTEEPTDTEVPTEEPTDAEVPTEEPTDAEVPTEPETVSPELAAELSDFCEKLKAFIVEKNFEADAGYYGEDVIWVTGRFSDDLEFIKPAVEAFAAENNMDMCHINFLFTGLGRPDTKYPTEEPTDTEAPTEDPTGELPQTGMPWAGAVQGLAAVLAIGGGALIAGSRRRDK